MDIKSNPSGLPSYSESIRSPQQASSIHLPRNIVQARKALVSSLLTTYVTPHLHQNVLCGLSSTILILVPSNVSSLHPPGNLGSGGPSETVVGFPSAENPTLVCLHGQENSLEFWRQVAVRQELGQQLRTHLENSGYRVIGDNRTSIQGQISPSADWSTVHEETLKDGEANFQIETKEICLRIVNGMGLYETSTGKAVVVEVNVGG